MELIYTVADISVYLTYTTLAGAPASGGLTCFGASYTRHAVEHQLHMHGVPN